MPTQPTYHKAVAGVKQATFGTLPLGYDAAFDKAVHALTLIKATPTVIDKPTGTITAKTDITWFSWGEAISMQLKPLTDSSTEISIASRPVFSLTIADYGKNARNINAICAGLLAG